MRCWRWNASQHRPLRVTDGSAEAEAPPESSGRRQVLAAGTAVMGVAALAGLSYPFLTSFEPSLRARSLGAPVTLDAGRIEPGALVRIPWRGHPVFVVRRTPAMLARLADPRFLAQLLDPDSEVVSQQPRYAQNATRSLRPELLVVIGICTHLGCVPLYESNPGGGGLGSGWPGGFFCPCHGSKFDLAGRVWKGVPAPTNLVVPPYRYVRGDLLEIGAEPA